MTEMQLLDKRLEREALEALRWEAMEREVAQRLPELCRDTVIGARMGRFRRLQILRRAFEATVAEPTFGRTPHGGFCDHYAYDDDRCLRCGAERTDH